MDDELMKALAHGQELFGAEMFRWGVIDGLHQAIEAIAVTQVDEPLRRWDGMAAAVEAIETRLEEWKSRAASEPAVPPAAEA
jgi:hypothetical protein